MNGKTKWSVAAATVVVTVASTAAVAAEGGVPEALNRINATLNALIATVKQLATSVDLLVASSGNSGSSAVLISPAFSVRPPAVLGAGNVGCSLTNVGSTPVTFKFNVIEGATGLPLQGQPAISDVAGPGQSRELTRTSGAGIRSLYCRFEADAPPSQLRAQMIVYANGDASAAADAR